MFFEQTTKSEKYWLRNIVSLPHSSMNRFCPILYRKHEEKIGVRLIDKVSEKTSKSQNEIILVIIWKMWKPQKRPKRGIVASKRSLYCIEVFIWKINSSSLRVHANGNLLIFFELLMLSTVEKSLN